MILKYFFEILISFLLWTEGISIRSLFTQDVTNYEVVYPVKISASGRLLSHNLRHIYPRVYESLPNHGGRNYTVNYRIAIDRKAVHVTLVPNFNFVARGALVESRRGKGITDIKLSPLSEDHCHYHGHIVGHRDSRAAISTCDGLAGYLILDSQLFLIEPLNAVEFKRTGRQPHVIYKTDSLENIQLPLGPFCGNRAQQKFLMSPKHNSYSGSLFHKQTVRSKMSKEHYIETLVVADKTMIAYHKNMDLEHYILTVFNMMNNAVVSSASNTLANFCSWQNHINPMEQSHPNHHDVAVFLTRVDLCDDENKCGLLGLAYTGGACQRDYMCSICEDNGLMLGFVIAHEIGHTLGMDHDIMEETGCPEELPDGSLTVMSPYLSMDIIGWSNCSREALHKFLDTDIGTCLEDRPTEPKYKIDDVLPGVLYDGTYQCKQMVDANATECVRHFSCKNLVCDIPSLGCTETDILPAPGTKCGVDKWCYKHQCIAAGHRPGSVNGEWNSWSAWSPCSLSCGVGVSHSSRLCNNPSPSHGGKYCLGERKRYKLCKQKECLEGLSLWETQCAEHNTETTKWIPFHHHDDTVIDGTPCMRGRFDICIGGSCQTIPCDGELGSKAIADVCGVCHGDGTTCSVKRNTKTFEENLETIQKILTIPMGVSNVIVQEETATLAKILLMHDHKNVLGSAAVGFFKIGSTDMLGWFGYIKPDQEMLNIPGPVTEPLKVFVFAKERVQMAYSMTRPARKSRKPQVHWEITSWGECSADCGVGTQVAHPQCIEKDAGIIEAIHCEHLDKPESQVRTCQVKPCIVD